MKELGILVGTGFDFSFGGRDKISSALKNRGYFVKEVDVPWPRNDYVFMDEKYFSDDSGNCVFGNGGMVQKGKDFALVSDAAFYYNEFSDKLNIQNLKSDRDYYCASKSFIVEEGTKKYNKKVHVAPTGSFFGTLNNGDIDLYTLVLPESKIIFYDNYFGKDSNKYNDYNKIAEEEGFKFICYDGSKENVWYPLNSLVLPRSQSDLVVLDKSAVSLMNILNKNNVDFISVDMPQREYVAGKINCQTNIFDKKDLTFLENSVF